jgi:predicted transcriptional regulator
MTKLLEAAVSKIRMLPEEDQDTLAVALFSMADTDLSPLSMDEETRAAVREGIVQARDGAFASKEEIEAIWNRFDA